MNIAVIIPCKEWNEWLLDCLLACKRMIFQDFEVWILPDDPPSIEWEARLEGLRFGARLHILPVGPANPARKRNIAMRATEAGIYGFIDADAYPRDDWLSKALPLLHGDVAAVCGPNLTPEQDPLMRRISGYVMKSPLGYGAAYIRHIPCRKQFVREMCTCNMIVTKVEGLYFRENLDTAEDMMFCADLRKREKKILYDPDIVVFHHRRCLFRPFIRQFYRYGRDKGHLAREGSDITYFWQTLPAWLILYLVGGCVWLLLPFPLLWSLAYFSPLILYGAVIISESFRISHSLVEWILTCMAFIAAHLSYGTGYIRGKLIIRH